MEGRKKLTVTAAEAGGHYGDLSLTLVWWPEGALFEAHVLGTMEDDCMLGWEGDGGHCERGKGCERRRGVLRKSCTNTGGDFIV